MGDLFAFVSVAASIVGIVALVRGRLAVARIGNRRQATLVTVVALVATGTIATVTAPPEPVSQSETRAAGSSAPAASADTTPATPSSPSTTPSETATTPAGTATTAPAPAEQLIATAAPRTALAVLGTLAVKGRAPMTGYSRSQFGPAWADTDRNGCDTRNDVLRRDLVHTVIKSGTHGCVVLSGDAAPDPYTGTTIHFVRGGASELDIDHVVALGDAWQKGAQQWPPAERLALANDPLNLLAVDSGANRQKGDGDAATWLPGTKGYRCAYVARQVGVKAKYHLWVTAAERDAIARVLSSCPAQVAPTGGNPTIAPISSGSGPVASGSSPRTSAPAPHATTSRRTTTAPKPATQVDPRFRTCGDAIDAGYGPYYSGKDPEYDWYQDRDHDGVVCER